MYLQWQKINRNWDELGTGCTSTEGHFQPVMNSDLTGNRCKDPTAPKRVDGGLLLLIGHSRKNKKPKINTSFGSAKAVAAANPSRASPVESTLESTNKRLGVPSVLTSAPRKEAISSS